MGVQFDNLDTDGGRKKLNGFLTSRSYMDGYSYSNADLTTFKKCCGAPDASKFPHVYRWYVHIASLLGVRAVLGSGKSSATPSGSPKKASKKEATKPQDDDDDNDDDEDDDLFGDDDEDEDEAAKEAAKKRADAAKNSKPKKTVIERSQVVLEVKPWEAETDLEELAAKIKATEIKGLKWGEGHKLVPVAFGIKKLLVQCIIIDDEVLLDDITECIEAFDDYVQSVDVASMNKV